MVCKMAERDGFTIYHCLYLCEKICRGKLRRNTDCSDSGDSRHWEVLDITPLYTENQKEQGWPLFFHGSAQSVRFLIVVPGGLGIGFIFYMLSK